VEGHWDQELALCRPVLQEIGNESGNLGCGGPYVLELQVKDGATNGPFILKRGDYPIHR
jgi:hypothetical protein